MNVSPLKNILCGALLLLTLACAPASAQRCPAVEISYANGTADQYTPRHFIAVVSGQALPSLTYSWSVSVPATIRQNSEEPDEVEIDLSGYTRQPVIVTAEVGGLPEGCLNTASFTLEPKDDSPGTGAGAGRPPSPTLPSLNCPVSVAEGTPIYFSASFGEGNSGAKPVYEWAVSQGSISGGRGASIIKVETAGLGNQVIRARLKVSGGDKFSTLSCGTEVRAAPYAYKLHEYSSSSSFEEKRASLRKFYLRLRAGLDEHAYIIVYGSKGAGAGDAKAEGTLAEKYLVDSGGIEAGRVVVVEGGTRREGVVELWAVQAGAVPKN